MESASVASGKPVVNLARGRCKSRMGAGLVSSGKSCVLLGLCVVFLLTCTPPVSSKVLKKTVYSENVGAGGPVQRWGFSSHIGPVLQQDGGSVCQPGTRRPHPFHCDSFLECVTDSYHSVRCPRYSAYDPLTKECSQDVSCIISINHGLFRGKRAVDGPEFPINENDPGSGEIVPDESLLNKDNSTVSTSTATTPASTATTTAAATTREQTTTKAMEANITSPSVATDSRTNDTSPKYSTMEVVIPDESPKPPYVIITEPPPEDSTTAGLADPSKAAGIGAIIGIIIALIAIGAIVATVVILVKKRKIKLSTKLPVKRKKKIVTRMENPQYGTGAAFRFSRDSTLYVGPTSTTLTKFNNPNLADTPLPKVLQAESPNHKRHGSLPRSIASRREKRRAPAPPNPFGEYDDDTQADLYEKASQGSADVELQTFTVKNELATEPDDNENEPSYPLLKRKEKPEPEQEKISSLENGKVKKDGKQEMTSQEPKEGNTNEEDDNDSKTNKSSTSLDKSPDFTLDEYDMTKNPFFTK